MLVDKGSDRDEVRANLLMKSTLSVIPPRANRKQPIDCAFNRYKDRNRIERMFNRLKQFRRIATRYDKTAKPISPSDLSPQQRFDCQTLSTGPSPPAFAQPPRQPFVVCRQKAAVR